jgi:hypothetical protein
MLITPVIDDNHPVQDYFPDRETGLLVTTFGAYMMMSFLMTFAGVILIQDKPFRDSELDSEYDSAGSGAEDLTFSKESSTSINVHYND